MATVLTSWTRLIVNHAFSSGVDPTPVLKGLGVDFSALGERIDAGLDSAVWNQLASALGDPDLGVHLAERSLSAGSLGIVGYLGRTSATLGEALLRGHRYQHLVKESTRFDVIWSSNTATVVERTPRDTRPRAFVEAKICNYVALARAWADRELNRPLQVRFQHSKPADTRELERFLGCPIYFDQPETALVLRRESLTIPLRTADRELAQHLDAWARARLAALGPHSFVEEVRGAVRAELAAPSIERVARRLSVSTRSLQRQLHTNGHSFRGVVDAIRHERAVELIGDGMRFASIAEELGFSDPRAFRRAFRRWTGTPPSQSRLS